MDELKPYSFCGGESEVFGYNIACEIYEVDGDIFIEPYTVHCESNCCFLEKEIIRRAEQNG